MKHALLFLGLLFSIGLSAQNVNLRFDELLTVPCPYDTTVSILSPAGFTFYQTLDDTYDGPVDSSRCVSLAIEPETGWAILPRDQIEVGRAVFARYEFSEGPIGLQPYTPYATGAAISTSQAQLLFGDTCAGELCTGLILGYDVPNEAGDGTVRRLRKQTPYSEFGGGSCLFTERFAGQHLQELVLKLTVAGADTAGRVRLNGLQFRPSFISTPEELIALEFGSDTWQDTAYVANFLDVAQPAYATGVYYLPQVENTYPSPENVNFVEAVPLGSLFEPAVMVLQFDLSSPGLHVLPYTAIRAAPVLSDTVRHTLYIDGKNESCTSAVVDLLGTGPDVHFRFGNDTLEFATARSCIMLKNGSSFQVKPGKKTLYGYGGVGTFGLLRDGWIRLHKNSELIIDNRLSLVCQPYDANDQAYVDLPPGSRLIFGENARLRRTAENGVMMLNVYMNGGELDDSALSPAERRLIRRIYPEPIPVQIDSAAAPTVFPNPVADQVQIFWPRWAATSSITSDYSWFDVAGRRVAAGQVLFQRGRSELPVIQLPAGWYLLELRAAGRKRVLKIVVK